MRTRLVSRWTLLPIGLLLVTAAGCAPQPAAPSPTLTVSAAADLTNAFREIGALFEKSHAAKVEFNFGSSGSLAQQIEQGAPVDVFAAANVAYIDQLAAKNRIEPDTKALYARGHLVLWQRAEAPFQVSAWSDLSRAEIKRVAIANPAHAPYGVAAQQTLESLQLWDALKDKIVLGENVRQTFQYAETGNVDAAFVALSLCQPGQGRWLLVPEDLHKPLGQALAVIAGTKQPKLAREFAAFVNGPEGRAVLRKYGLTLPGESLPAELVGEPIAEPQPAATP